MKKGLTVFITLFMCIVFFAGCNAQKPSDLNSGSDTASAQAQEPTPEVTQVPTPEPTPTPVPYPTEFNMGDTLVFGGQFEITMTDFEFATKVEPPRPGSFYTYYDVKDNTLTYAHTVFSVKNLGGDGLPADQVMSVKIIYDGKYEYDGFSAIEEDGGQNFTYTNITEISPLTTDGLHFLNEVPLEVSESGKDVAVEIQINNKTYTYTGQKGNGERIEMQDEVPVAGNVKWQEFNKLTLKEPAAIENYGELTLNSTDFSSKVKPPKAKGFYTYYEMKNAANTYLHVAFSFKNLMTSGKNADEVMNVKAVYDNKYEYSGFSVIEEDRGKNFTYTNITNIDPLTVGGLHFLIEVPKEVQESDAPLALVININGEEYQYVIR